MSGGFTPGLTYGAGVHSAVAFLASGNLTTKRGGVTLDASVVDADANGDKVVEAGTFVTTITANGKYGPYRPAVNEVQTVTISGAPTGGTFTLTFSGQTTALLPHNATADQVRSALLALSNIGVGDVSVTGSPGGPFTVAFLGLYAGTDVAQMTAADAFTGGTTPDVAVTTTTAGGAGAAPVDGRQTPSDDTSGYLMESVNLRDGDVICGLLLRGSVVESRVFPAPDEMTKAAVKGRITFQ